MEQLRKEAESKKKLIWDVIHGYMEFHPLLLAFIDTTQLQRLRYIKQLGGVNYVFPNATHTRFEHALGSCHLASELIRKLQRKQPELGITDAEVLCVGVAALCHDLGHGPFSHVFQRFAAQFLPSDCSWSRIDWSVKMFDELLVKNPHVKKMCEHYEVDIDGYHGALVKDMIRGKQEPSDDSGDEEPKRKRASEEKPFLLEIVRNKWSGFDVCKMDYITRDSHNTAMSGNMEWRRYIDYARVIDRHICTRTKVAGNLADMLDQQRKLYKKAYYHKTVRMIEYKITCALFAAREAPVILKSDRSRVSVVHTILKEDMDAYTRLTDSILHQMLEVPLAVQTIQEIELRGHESSISFLACAAYTESESPVAFELHGIKDFSRKLAKACETELKIGPADGLTTENPFWVDFVEYDYGLESRNPFDCKMFYTRDNPDEAVSIPRDQIPRSLPAQLYEIELRVYSISQQHKQVYEQNKEKFNKIFTDVCEEMHLRRICLR